jgi:hypothetical protein
LFLQFGMSMFFGVGKPVFVSEFKKCEILTVFVTSQTLNIAQNCPINNKIAINLDKMIICSLNLAWLCFLGWENRCWCQNSKIFKSWPLLWRYRPPILPKIVQNLTKSPQISTNWLFVPQIWHYYVFWGEKTGAGDRIPKFSNLDHFFDVRDIITAQKCPKNT